MQPYSLKHLCLYFLRLGTLGFGGPVALVGYTHRDLVVKRKLKRCNGPSAFTRATVRFTISLN
jgi:hypothetical protein